MCYTDNKSYAKGNSKSLVCAVERVDETNRSDCFVVSAGSLDLVVVIGGDALR